jgi:hypothetical protein
MKREELLKELDMLSDACDSNYALEVNGYRQGVLDAIDVVNKYFVLSDVRQQSELLKAFADYYQSDKYNDEMSFDTNVDKFLEAFNCA